MKRRWFIVALGLVGGVIAMLAVAVSLGLMRKRGPLERMGRPRILLSRATHESTSTTTLVSGEVVRIISNDTGGETASLDYCTGFAGDHEAMQREANRVWSHFSSAVAGQRPSRAIVVPVVVLYQVAIGIAKSSNK